MPWQYDQSSGNMSHNGVFLVKAYSGAGIGKDNPEMEQVRNVGPIPKGMWRIGSPRNSAQSGPYVLDLTPIGHTAHGRTDFLIHGDKKDNPGNASTGCIILNRKYREQIVKSNDYTLIVVR
ncbi:MAG: DUF2778 domain-containing protein [Gammaproteobacteria bacterium]|nr:DUF2778 domain-containing protein [Gammaproteobacteria bacterium]